MTALHPAIAQALAPYAPPQSSVQSRKLTIDQIYDLLTEQHSLYVDDPIYTHLDTSLEDMADHWSRAEKRLKAEQAETAWAELEDMPGFAGTYARLGALSLQRVAA